MPFNVSSVYRIFELPKITQVPNTPEYLPGVMNTHEKVLPVIDLRILFEMEATQYTRHTAVIVTTCSFENETGGHFQDVGLLVDTVHNLKKLIPP